jgi:hypothetical protein
VCRCFSTPSAAVRFSSCDSCEVLRSPPVEGTTGALLACRAGRLLDAQQGERPIFVAGEVGLQGRVTRKDVVNVCRHLRVEVFGDLPDDSRVFGRFLGLAVLLHVGRPPLREHLRRAREAGQRRVLVGLRLQHLGQRRDVLLEHALSLTLGLFALLLSKLLFELAQAPRFLSLGRLLGLLVRAHRFHERLDGVAALAQRLQDGLAVLALEYLQTLQLAGGFLGLLLRGRDGALLGEERRLLLRVGQVGVGAGRSGGRCWCRRGWRSGRLLEGLERLLELRGRWRRRGG